MRAKLLITGVSIAAMLGAAACTTNDPYSSAPRRNNTATGAIAGALGGAVLGYLTNTSDGEQGRRYALFGAGIGLGSVLGYLVAGIVIGPVLGVAGSAGTMADLQHFAEFGVVMMLFLIGLELEPQALWQMRKKLLGLAGMQILGTVAALTLVCMALNQSWQVAVTLGMIMSLSSTAIVLQTLSEKNLMQTRGGRDTFAVLLIGRSRFGWRGHSAVRMLYAGAALLLLAYAGSRFVMEVLLPRAGN